MKKIRQILVILVMLPILFACGNNKEVMMATTTSMNDSGLLDVLAPAFKTDTGIGLKWTSVGSGEAMNLARDGEAQLLFAHSPSAEEELVKDGVSKGRHVVMFNNFLFVGPQSLNTSDLATATKEICNDKPYVSRNDNSGTWNMEVRTFEEYCKSATAKDSIDSGSGMLDTLVIANEEKRYTLVDIATWLQNRKDLPNLTEAFYNKKDLLNVYSIHQINNDRFTEDENNNAAEFVKWISEGRGQELIKEYGQEQFGEPVFTLGDGK
jgi:tungstate transport system substrate-binding protein